MSTGDVPSLSPRLKLDSDIILTEAMVGDLVRALRLRTYPGLEDVPFEARGCRLERPFDYGNFGLPESEQCTPDSSKYIELHPLQPWPDGWFVASMEQLPPRTRSLNKQGRSNVIRDEMFVRFRPQTFPMPTDVSGCFTREEGASTFGGFLSFSEGVVDSKRHIERLIAMSAGAESTCTVSVRTELAIQAFSSVDFFCENIDESVPWTLTFSEGLVSTTGVPLRNLDGATAFELSWMPSEMDPFGNGCSRWWPTW
jgi:hypothetical protein